MSEMKSKAGENGLGSITLTYDGSGASKATDSLGMRAMQARVWEKRDAQHLLVKSPPASGKSRAAMFVGLEKLRANAVDRVVVAVPERSIGASFRDTSLATGGFHSNWRLDLDLCTVGSETGRKVDELIGFLRGEGAGRTALCTHSTLRAAYAKTDDVTLFDRALVCVDELHHASSDENSRLGNLLRGLIDRAGEVGHDAAHILAMTGSYFRGDGTAVLHPQDEARFERVIYTYYEQLNGYDYLKVLRINFRFYQGKYLDAIGGALDPHMKTIVHIPHVGSAEGMRHASARSFAARASSSSSGFACQRPRRRLRTSGSGGGAVARIIKGVTREQKSRGDIKRRELSALDGLKRVVGRGRAFDFPAD